MKKLNRLVRDRANRWGVSASFIASFTGMDQAQVSRLFSGERGLSYRTMALVCAALMVDPEAFKKLSSEERIARMCLFDDMLNARFHDEAEKAYKHNER